MSQLIVSFLIVFLPTLLLGQKLSLDVEKIGDSLRTAGIDTFIVYKNYHPGSLPHCISFDKSASEEEIREAFCEKTDAVYVFYMQKGQLYIQKRNECYFFKPEKIDSCKAFTSYLNDYERIANEKILPNSYVDKKGDTLFVIIDHSDLTDLYLSRGTSRNLFTVDWFDLQPTASIRGETGGNKNINYEHNIKTAIKDLILSIADKLSRLTFTKD